MAYQDRYEQYFNQIPTDIQKQRESGRRIALGYTSDLDVILDWNSDTFAGILAEYLKEEPSFLAGDVIDSMASFARILSYYMIHGLGGEIDVTSIEVCDYLQSHFKAEYGLGGTCAQGSAALNKLGFPVVVHLTDQSKEVCRLLDGPGLEVVTPEGVVPIMQGVSDEPPILHIILQYSKDEKIHANGKTYQVPVSNRLIMDYDKMLKYVPLDRCFLDYCETNAKDMLVYGISGFNGILDVGIMEKKLEELIAHCNVVKERNPNCAIYMEGACYMNSDVRDLVFHKMAGVVDIFGMNEEELVDHTKMHGMHTDKEDIVSVLEGLQLLIETYPVQGIVLHTKDYSMYYGNPMEKADFVKGLTLGNLMAGTRARIGRYGTLEECGESLKLSLSHAGIAFAEQLARVETKKCAYLVPSRYMEHPKYTIGLGDTFMAGFLLSYVN